jgi:arsenate reductase (glutaredoxin)
MPIKVYGYKNCSTCQKAIKFLELHKITFDKIPIVDRPPSLGELKRMLLFLKDQGHNFKKLFNTSGAQYRELDISDKIKMGLTEEAALELLSQNGKLIKRPFLLTDTNGTVGFDEDQWKKLLIS